MSKNFELLQQVNREQELFRPPDSPAAPGADIRVASGDQGVRDIRPSLSSAPKKTGWWRLRLNGRENGGPDVGAVTCEEQLKLVQRLFLSAEPAARSAVVFGGIDDGAESSRICAQAAETLAAHGKKSVCVVDANLRSPCLHKYFGLENRNGLAEAATKSGSVLEFARQLPGTNLWFMPAGSMGSKRQVLLNPEGVNARIAELREQFDHVLISAPSLNSSADSILLGQRSDGVVLVLEANSTRREAARKVKENLEAANVQLLGVVFNNRTFPVPESLYRRL